jgi:hypothetical protein
MPKFTKGPWKATTSRCNRRQISGANGKQIALIWRHGSEETHANECLIIAAPNLYNEGIKMKEEIKELVCNLRAQLAQAIADKELAGMGDSYIGQTIEDTRIKTLNPILKSLEVILTKENVV